MITPVILAGGSGTRLWPLSREYYPKQMLTLINSNTMLQNTVLRLMDIEGLSNPIIVCNENHRFLIAEQFLSIGVKPSAIVLEPVGKNTAPAIAVAAHLAMKGEKDPTLLVLPADHHIEDKELFQKTIKVGKELADKKFSVTFGIVPDSPETGYGYIKKGKPVDAEKTSSSDENRKGFFIKTFVEKPDRETAESYLKSGEYVWNSGMFMFKSSAILDELEIHAPDIKAACIKSVSKGKHDLDFFRLDPESFKACPSDSIDYAIMEKTNTGVVVPFNGGWSDIGSWDALWEAGKKDDNQNVIKGDVLLHDVEKSYIHSNERAVAVVGIKDQIVVETSDAVLVAPRSRAQDVKHIVSELKAKSRSEAYYHKKEYRPWGFYETLHLNDRYQVKHIIVKPGAKLSSQKHFHRAEHWIVVNGTALVTKNGAELVLKEDESTYISVGEIHRLENPGKIPLELIEVQTGSYIDEDDIIRFDDMYGRQVIKDG